jgi:hypothetical protein
MSALKFVLVLGACVLIGSLGLVALALEPGYRQSAELEKSTQNTILRLKGKEETVQKYLDGKLTFLETAAHFRALDQGAPGFNWEEFRDAYPGDSDEERHCREVIACVRALPSSQGSSAGQETVKRLEAELRRHLRDGTPKLPAVDSPDEHGETCE